MLQNLFSVQAKTLPISVTSTASTSAALPAIGNSIRLVNEGSSICFVAVGVTSQTATLPNATPTATSVPILPGEDCVFAIPNPQGTPAGDGTFTAPTPLNISAVCRAAATTTLLVQVSEGC